MRKYIAVGLLLVGFSIGVFLPHPVENCPTETHYSYFSAKPFFEDAYRNAPQSNITATDIKGVILNHHLFAPHLIAEALTTVATTSPTTVVLISPNHFSAGRGSILTSLYQWETPYGVLKSDCRLIKHLQARGVLAVEEPPFEKEHGISGIVSFIKKSLPNARIVPIIVKDYTPSEKIVALARELHIALGDQALIVGSFDFSHYVTDAVAQAQDQESIQIIRNFDYAKLRSYAELDTIAIDSIPGLELFLRYTSRMGAMRFELLANTNSSQILQSPTSLETTSYINGVFW